MAITKCPQCECTEYDYLTDGYMDHKDDLGMIRSRRHWKEYRCQLCRTEFKRMIHIHYWYNNQIQKS
jgi:hypothetical protein